MADELMEAPSPPEQEDEEEEDLEELVGEQEEEETEEDISSSLSESHRSREIHFYYPPHSTVNLTFKLDVLTILFTIFAFGTSVFGAHFYGRQLAALAKQMTCPT